MTVVVGRRCLLLYQSCIARVAIQDEKLYRHHVCFAATICNLAFFKRLRVMLGLSLYGADGRMSFNQTLRARIVLCTD